MNLVDQPGFAVGTYLPSISSFFVDLKLISLVGSIAEKMATIRHGASAMASLYNAVVPIFTIIIRRAFGVAGGAFANPDGDDWGKRVAWFVFPNVLSRNMILIGSKLLGHQEIGEAFR